MLLINLFHHRTRHSRRSPQRPPRRPLALEPLEARNLLDGGLANVLVNNPALDTRAQDTQSETAIVLGAGSKVIVAYNNTVDATAGNYLGTGYSRSANGGTTFEDQGSVPYQNVGDPTLARSAKTGTVFLSTIGVDQSSTNPNPPPPVLLSGLERIDVFRSTNNGASFQAPADGMPGFDPAVDGQDKPWIAVDNFPGPGYGNVYLITRHYFLDASGNYKFDLLLTRSTDDGVTFGPNRGTTILSPRDNTFHGPNVVVGPDHAVYVFWWDTSKMSKGFATNPQIVMSKSTDQGVTFSDPVTVTGLRTALYAGDLALGDSAGHPFTTNAFPQAAVNPVTGDIYVTFADWDQPWSVEPDIYFTQSTDGGRKWSKPVQVNDDLTSNDQWFPALAVTPDGSHVGLFWYDRRLDPANHLIDRYGAIGAVSGHTVTFGANFRITDMSFPPALTYWTGSEFHIQDPSIRPGYMGDYDQAVADNDYFYTTWGDNRLADAFHANQPDVRLAKVPVDWLATNPLSATNPATASATTQSAGALLIAAAGAGTEPGALLFSEASWKGLAVDAYFLDLARTNETTSSIARGDTLDWHIFGLSPSVPGDADQFVPPPTWVFGTPTPALARRATHGPPDDWGMDNLTLADLSWGGEAGTWPAG